MELLGYKITDTITLEELEERYQEVVDNRKQLWAENEKMIRGEVARGSNNLYGNLAPVQSIGINTDKSAIRDRDFSIPLGEAGVGFESSSPRTGKLKRNVDDLQYEADKA